jgi:hypothetical protein
MGRQSSPGLSPITSGFRFLYKMITQGIDTKLIVMVRI